MAYFPLPPPTCRLTVCQACGYRRITAPDDDTPDCPHCPDAAQHSTRVHPHAHAVALFASRDPFSYGEPSQ